MDSVVFRLCDKAPDILREVCLERGWEEYCEDGCEANGGWNLWWKTQGFTLREYGNCRPWQRLNHFPKSSYITKKDGLARNLRRMKTSYGGSIFDFFPRTFILPNEYKKFVAEFSKQDGGQRSNYWICKPTEQSCGRGIFIFQDLHDLTYDCAVVVQKYIIKPLLISGYKFDLRLYAIVTSFHPFQMYIYHEGIVRFSTEKFDLSTLDNRFSHLTNTSINKTGPQYSAEKGSVGVGCKWTLSQLRVYFYKHNIDDRLLWHRITSIIIITLLSQAQEVPSDSSNCFEMFGFDVLIDEKMKPWLLEVNFSPALGNDCMQDELVKRPLLNDILEILNFSEADIKRGNEKEKTGNRKKSLKARDLVHNTPKGVTKATSLRTVGQQSSKNSLIISPRQTGYESIDLVELSKDSVIDERKQGTQVGVAIKMTSKNLSQKGSAVPVVGANDGKAMKSRRCSTPCSKYNLSSQKRLSTSVEFLKAVRDDSDSQANSDTEKADLKETEAPLRCTAKEGDSAFKREADNIPLEQKSQTETFFSEKTTDGENGEQTVRQQRLTRTQTQSSMDLSRPEHKSNGLPCHLRMRRYNSELSSLSSLQSVDKYVLPHSSMGNLHCVPSQYSPRVSTGVKRSSKKACNTLKPQIGNCILAFPFNEVTHKASQGKLDQRVIVEEIRKILKATGSHIKSSPSEASNDGGNSLDLSKPFWGFRSKLNTFYSSL